MYQNPNQYNQSYPTSYQEHQPSGNNMIYGQPVYANPDSQTGGISMGQPIPQNMNAQPIGMRPMINPEVIVVQQFEQGPNPYPQTKYPTEIYCAACGYTGMSIVNNEIGNGTWTICLIGTCFGCFPCSLLPFCVDDCQDQVHLCPNCGVIVGQRKFLFD